MKLLTNEEIGKKVRKLREERNLSKEEFSKETGIPLSNLDLLEEGKFVAALDIYIICKAFSVDVEDLISDK